jgi:spore coat polysaccharide biosynthesis protein SpsF (cytidylyltransferase family)
VANAAVLVLARMGSERLPGKTLAPVWLATTGVRIDELLAAWGAELGMHVHQGSVDDVLERFIGVADCAEAAWLVRVTADNPLVRPAEIEALCRTAAAAPPGVANIGAGDSRQQLESVHRTHVTSGFAPDARTS